MLKRIMPLIIFVVVCKTADISSMENMAKLVNGDMTEQMQSLIPIINALNLQGEQLRTETTNFADFALGETQKVTFPVNKTFNSIRKQFKEEILKGLNASKDKNNLSQEKQNELRDRALEYMVLDHKMESFLETHDLGNAEITYTKTDTSSDFNCVLPKEIFQAIIKESPVPLVGAHTVNINDIADVKINFNWNSIAENRTQFKFCAESLLQTDKKEVDVILRNIFGKLQEIIKPATADNVSEQKILKWWQH